MVFVTQSSSSITGFGIILDSYDQRASLLGWNYNLFWRDCSEIV